MSSTVGCISEGRLKGLPRSRRGTSGCAGGACLGRVPWQWELEAQHWGTAPRRPACPPTSSSALSSCKTTKLVSELETFLVPVLTVLLLTQGELGILIQLTLERRICAD